MAQGLIVGRSALIVGVLRLVEKVAPGEHPVLVVGPTGSGKELVARAIHSSSRLANGPFVAQNCAAFHENLLESELFGYVRGAFTGAERDKRGIFDAADGGTLFLDEVGEMSQALQAKLLRVLEERVFLPVGATLERQSNVRIVAATNRDLRQMVEIGKFRQDLYYRLHGIAIEIPPLSKRKEDIPLLVEHFLGQCPEGDKKGFAPGVLEMLMSYSWPGNIRELRNEIDRLTILSRGEEVIRCDHLSPQIREQVPQSPSNTIRPSKLRDALEIVERELILDTLNNTQWNKSTAARVLGISRSSLIAKVRAYGFERSK